MSTSDLDSTRQLDTTLQLDMTLQLDHNHTTHNNSSHDNKECTRCHKIFQYPYLLKRHLQAKEPCKITPKQQSTNVSTCNNVDRHNRGERDIIKQNNIISNFSKQDNLYNKKEFLENTICSALLKLLELTHNGNFSNEYIQTFKTLSSLVNLKLESPNVISVPLTSQVSTVTNIPTSITPNNTIARNNEIQPSGITLEDAMNPNLLMVDNNANVINNTNNIQNTTNTKKHC